MINWISLLAFCKSCNHGAHDLVDPSSFSFDSSTRSIFNGERIYAYGVLLGSREHASIYYGSYFMKVPLRLTPICPNCGGMTDDENTTNHPCSPGRKSRFKQVLFADDDGNLFVDKDGKYPFPTKINLPKGNQKV